MKRTFLPVASINVSRRRGQRMRKARPGKPGPGAHVHRLERAPEQGRHVTPSSAASAGKRPASPGNGALDLLAIRDRRQIEALVPGQQLIGILLEGGQLGRSRARPNWIAPEPIFA